MICAFLQSAGTVLHQTSLLLIYCRVYDLELRLKTPEKFLHPNYEELTWYAAQGLLQKLEGGPLAYVLKLLCN